MEQVEQAVQEVQESPQHPGTAQVAEDIRATVEVHMPQADLSQLEEFLSWVEEQAE